MFCIADKYIPYLQGRLEPYLDKVSYLEPAEITHDAVCEADVLLIRTRTRCDESLLHDTKVRFIGTATIGTDHIDSLYCRQHQIVTCNAPGCNARGVAQYVESALSQSGILKTALQQPITIGIVGVGHVGSLVQQMAERHGLRVMLYDPPRMHTEGGQQWTADLSDIARKADIITFHTPLTKTGEYKTYHLADLQFLSQCKHGAVIINAARGGIIDEEALCSEQMAAKNFRLIIDTWDGEPHINEQLLKQTTIATPHIAGYSEEGKRNATRMILEQLSQYLGININIDDLQTDNKPLPIYDIMADDKLLRQSPDNFEQLREQYKLR